ncbi:RNA polymerase sigma factor [Aeromicrobium sp.]|uniref:RNA polymerase sigma factor n=1 Tax=Aeromicrobium sp. TaxID=1871063 RepID=UPI0030C46CE5
MDEDEQLVARARAGEAWALEELLAAIRPRVVRRCARLLPHTLDAEEAAQDALLSVATHLRDYSGQGSFEGWVTVIASNSARQTYRTLKRRFAERAVEELPVSPDPRTTSVIAGSRLDLLDAIEALEQVHPAATEAFVLRDIAALPYEEIAQLTQTPLGTVKARIHTARGFVRERLGVDVDNF